MKYDEFAKHVKTLAETHSTTETEQAIRATLETLKERILGDEASQLAAQLPEQIGQYLRGREGENGDHFTLKEFYRRVSEKAGVEEPIAIRHARAVFTVLQSAVTPGEFTDVRINLSQDYDELFATNADLS